jgi:hypothetical protein
MRKNGKMLINKIKKVGEGIGTARVKEKRGRQGKRQNYYRSALRICNNL